MNPYELVNLIYKFAEEEIKFSEKDTIVAMLERERDLYTPDSVGHKLYQAAIDYVCA